MEFKYAHSNTIAKLPILKLAQENGTSVTKMSVPVTAEEKTNKKNDVKARSLLLIALTNEHQLTFISTASFSDNAVYAFMVENPNGSNLLQRDLGQIHEDDLERTCKKIFINANDIAGYDKSKVECFNCHKMGHFARECRAPRNKEGHFRNQDNTRKHGNNEDTSSKAMLAIDGVGFDWSDMEKEHAQTNMDLWSVSDSEINCNHHQRKRIVSRNNYNRVDYDYYAKTTHPSVHRNMTPRAVLLKTGLTPLNTVRPVNTAHPKPAVHSAKSIYVNTAMRHYHTERPRAGNTARSYTEPVNAVRAKRGKPLMDDKGFVDSGCSRHMTGNIAYLSDFKEFDGGYASQKEVETLRYLSLVVPLKKVGDEAVYKELSDRMERAATTASNLEAEHESAKAKTVNGEHQLQALVDKNKVIIMKTSIRSDLHLEDTGGTDCLPTATIFKELARMGSKQRKETKVPQDETHHDDSVPIPSNDPLLNGEDRMKLTKLMIFCTNLQKQVLDLEKAKDAQAKEIAGLKKRGDASKQGRSFEDIDKDAEVSLVDETQGRSDEAEIFDTDDLHSDEVIVDMAVGEKQEQSAKVDEREVSTGVEDSATGIEDSVAPTILVTTVGEGVTAIKIDEITTTSAPITTIDEITLAQILIEIKAAKPKVVTTVATTTTTTRPKARGVVAQELSEFRTTTSSPQASQPSKTKDKGKAIMIEPEVPLKKNDQVALDEEMARNLKA
ncbi:ribonuclease H-like domain-containing protein [Tanacetum coccineum]